MSLQLQLLRDLAPRSSMQHQYTLCNADFLGCYHQRVSDLPPATEFTIEKFLRDSKELCAYAEGTECVIVPQSQL